MVSQTTILTTRGDIVRAHSATQLIFLECVTSNPVSISRTVVEKNAGSGRHMIATVIDRLYISAFFVFDRSLIPGFAVARRLPAT
jgi:hypothetical protein